MQLIAALLSVLPQVCAMLTHIPVLQSAINNHADVSTLVRKLSRTHMVIDVCDDNDANLLQHFDKALQFIQNALAAKGRVLVHCHAGVSRSASVSLVCRYKHAARGLSADQKSGTYRWSLHTSWQLK